MKIWQLAKVTVFENIAARMLLTNIFFLVCLLVLIAFVQDSKEEFNHYKLFLDGSFSLIMFFNLFFAMMTSFSLLESDRLNNRISVLISSYMNRDQYIFGKFLGGFFSSLINLVIICILVSSASLLVFNQHPNYIFYNYFVSVLELLMFVSLVFFCSIAFSRFMGVMSFLFIFILGHFTYYIKYYTRVVGTEYPNLVQNLYLLLPNFEYFGIKNHLIAGKSIPSGYFMALLLFSLAWTTLFLLISQIVFSRKSFQ
tara:strand:- start:1955 stop:2719 length:765 start_codon:yes stop_codon:yes gene_type:complete